MMGTQEIATALAEWCRELIPELQGSFDHAFGSMDKLLPNVAAEFQSTRTAQEDVEHFPYVQIEQGYIRTHFFTLMILTDPKADKSASQFLASCADKITLSLFSDDSCGDRLTLPARMSLVTETSYDPPFVEIDDGTEARLVTIEVYVGDVIQEDL